MVHASLPITSLWAISGTTSYVWVNLRNLKASEGNVLDRRGKGHICDESEAMFRPLEIRFRFVTEAYSSYHWDVVKSKV